MKRLLIFIIILSAIFGVIFVWWQNGVSAVNSLNQTRQTFVIQNGEGVREIANNLKSAGIIKDPVIFFLMVKQLGLDGKIQAGEFHLSPAMNTFEIAKALQTGTFDLQITIPEGKRAEEIADILKEQLPGFKEAWREQLRTNEGYLFPDTYSFAKNATIDEIIQTMRDNFQRKYAGISVDKPTTLSQQELVTIASLVEREAKYPQDRPLVASVIFNRLNQGMPLQIDATIQYALAYQPQGKTWWKKDLTEADLQLDSSYNTYIHTGLPPTPISNPGLAVLTAVINPPVTDYFFYVSDRSGHDHFAKTLAEHNANIQKYGL